MTLKTLTEPFPWVRYSRKLTNKIMNPRSVGVFREEESLARGMRLVIGEAGKIEDGNIVRLYWLVDKEDGQIVDAKFQILGQSALIGAAEAACQLCIRKNYDQASRLTTDLIDKELRDKSDEPAFPHETFPHLNLILEAIDVAKAQCTDLPLPTSYIAPPMPVGPQDILLGGYPGWLELSLEKKIAVIEKVLDDDVRPYISLDAGGVEIVNLVGDREVVISYQGTCTSCYSSVGTTLSYIQQTLRNKVHPNLVVIPDVDFASPYPH
jgi:NifU-like protein